MAGPPANTSSGGGHGAGTTQGSTGGGGHDSPSMAAFFAQRQLVIERVMQYYAAGLCGLIAAFVIFRWARWLCAKVERSSKPAGVLGRPFVGSSR
jgi:hypothetical protein